MIFSEGVAKLIWLKDDVITLKEGISLTEEIVINVKIGIISNILFPYISKILINNKIIESKLTSKTSLGKELITEFSSLYFSEIFSWNAKSLKKK